MKDYIIDQIAKRRTELNALERRRAIVEAELRLLEEMNLVAEQQADGQRHRITAVTASDSRTHLQPRWRCVLVAAVERYPNPIRNDEIAGIQRAAGEQPSNSQAIRTHVSTQAKLGRYEKLGRGMFRATKMGADLAGLALPEHSEDSPKGEPGLDFGGLTPAFDSTTRKV